MSLWKPPSYWSKVSPQQPASYIIYKDDLGYICAKNGSTGKIDFRGTDAATVIQSAIDALGSNGGKIFIKSGDYDFESTLKIDKSITLISERGAKVNLNGQHRIAIENTANVIIKGLEIYGGSDGVAISTLKSTKVIIENCYIHDILLSSENRAHGIFVYNGSSYITVRNNVIEKIAWEDANASDANCVTIDTSDATETPNHILIEGNIFRQAQFYAVKTYGGYVAILKNFMSDFNGHGINILGTKNSSKYPILTLGNTIKNVYYHGIHVSNDAENVVILGNTVENIQEGYGIYVGSDSYEREVLVVANIIKNTQKHGILVYNATNVKVIANILKDAAQTTGNGIYVSTSDNIDIVDNILHNVSSPISTYNSTNVRIVHNIGYVTENIGVAIFSGDGSTTDFEIGAHGLAVTDPEKIVVKVTPISSDAIAASPCVGYVDPADNTKIRVKFASAPASGTDNVKVKWLAEVC